VVHHRRPVLRIRDGRHDGLRLVEQEVVEPLRVRLDALAIELDRIALGVRLPPDLRHLPIDRHPPFADQLLGLAPGGDPRTGLDAFLAHGVSSGLSASASAISAASRRIRSSRSSPPGAISTGISAASDAIMSSVAWLSSSGGPSPSPPAICPNVSSNSSSGGR